jgi:UDP:flavonoid glycosyltransferase YjiC (YdhE family)
MPLIALAQGLRARDHEIVLCCDPPARRYADALGMHALVDPDAWQAADRRGHAAHVGGLGAYFDAVNRALVPLVSRAIKDVRPDLVLASLLTAPLARLLAPEVRWCAVNSTYCLRADDGDPVGAYFGPILASLPFVLHATDAVFDGAADLPPGHHYTGPLLWEPALPVPPYLEQAGDPWALVTGSSEAQGDAPLVEAALNALAQRALRVIATTNAAISDVPPNARVEATASHHAILARSRLLVSHGGHGSVMKALWHGVPMVLVPWSRDQPGVAARAERLGVARVVPPSQLTTLGREIDAVLSDPRYAEAAARHGRRMRETDAVAIACGLVERELRG